MSKVDFKKVYRELYIPPRKFVIVDVPKMRFLMVDGHGDPNIAPEYQQAVEALYAVTYKLKFNSKKQLAKDYVVTPLEGLWWAEDMNAFSTTRDKSQWSWIMMIMTPEWITQELYDETIEMVRKGKCPTALDRVRLQNYHEGLSVQIMHIGSYDDEAPTLLKLHSDFIPRNGYIENGKHHEIYLSDPRRVVPEKLKTVLRQPVKARGLP